MKSLPWQIEPVTKDRYLRDEDPTEPLLGLPSEYRRLPDFTPPAVWGDFRISDPRWDAIMLRRNDREYTKNASDRPDAPVPISVQIKMFGKSYARKQGLWGPGVPGLIMWTWFPRIEPCWMIVTHSEACKLLSEEEAGMKH